MELREPGRPPREGREGRRGRRNGDQLTDTGNLPVAEVANSRLLDRLRDLKDSVARQQPGVPKKANSHTIIFFFLICVIPSALITGYMYFVASDQYHSELKFSVRSSLLVAQATTGVSALGSTTNIMDLADSYVVQEYLLSREFVEDLHKQVNLHTIYSKPEVDWWYRMPEKMSAEKMVDYMRMMQNVTFDMFSGIISIQVRAFSADDAKKMGDEVLQMSQALVNRITEKARMDIVKDAQDELTRSEKRLSAARAAIAGFRSEVGDIDPASAAASAQVSINSMESDLTRLKADLNQLNKTMAPSSPRVRVQQDRVDALEKQIDLEKTKVALKTRAGEAYAERLAKYESLLAERDFAMLAWTSASGTLERARMDAERNQRYLAQIVSPRVAQDALYPQRGRYALLSFLALFATWAIGTLVIGAVRDHMG